MKLSYTHCSLSLCLTLSHSHSVEILTLISGADCPNLMPFESTRETDKAAYLIRPYIYLDLYDRISTRPFLTDLEKTWIVFQLLSAAKQAHEVGVTHGDIKTNNVLVTSSTWVFLTDFANYKPTFLPEDNPADFSYFFDISGRRACYIAPERFYDSKSKPSASQMSMPPTPEMDLFSIGCVIAELWADGRPLFDYSHLLAYRHRSTTLSALGIDAIDNPGLKALITTLTDLDPARRMSAATILQQERGRLFPEYFYTCLHPFLSRLLVEDADTRVATIVKHFPLLLSQLGGPTTAATSTPTSTTQDGTGQGEATPAPSSLSFPPGSRLGETLGDSVTQLEAVWAARHQEMLADEQMVTTALGQQQHSAGTAALDSAAAIAASAQQVQQAVEAATETVQAASGVTGATGGEDHDTQARTRGPKLVIFDSLPLPATQGPGQRPSLTDPRVSRRSSSVGALGSGMSLVVSEVCSCLRGCVRSLARMQCLAIMLDAAPLVTDEVLFQRMVPYAIAVLGDSNNSVRALAINVVASLLQQVNSFPPADAHVFHEYIFPALARFTKDPVEIVRVAYAQNLATLAETSRRFLDIAQLLRENDLFAHGGHDEDQSISYVVPYDKELDNLQDAVVRTLTDFLIDTSTPVRRATLGQLSRISIFLGRQKTNDSILPLVITFLNSRDWELRRAFFHNVVGVSAYLGRRSLEDFVLPCIMQALFDEEEFVIEKALMALARLTTIGLFTKHVLLDIIGKVAPLLCHPCTWIRYGAASFIVAVGDTMSLADTQCLLLPGIKPFLKREVIELTTQSLLEALRSPVRQYAFDRALRMPTHFHQQEPLPPSPPSTARTDSKGGSSSPKKGKKDKDKKGKKKEATSTPPAETPAARVERMSRRRQSFRHDVDKTPFEASLPTNATPTTSGPSPADSLSDNRARAGSAELPILEADDDDFPLRLYIDNLSPDDEAKLRHMRPYIAASAQAMMEKSKVWESENTARMLEPSELEQISTLSQKVTVHTVPIHDKTEFFFPPSSKGGNPAHPHKAMAEEYNSFFGLPAGQAGPGAGAGSSGNTGAGAGAGAGGASAQDNGSNASAATAGGGASHPNAAASAGSAAAGHSTPVDTEASSATANSSSGAASLATPDVSALHSRHHPGHILGHSRSIPPPPPDLGTLRPEPAGSDRNLTRESTRRKNKGSTRGDAQPDQPDVWRPRGILVAHLHEHRAAVNNVCVSADSLFIASGSDDGTVKIWDGQRIEKDVTNRSRLTYSSQAGKISALAICENTHSVASASSEGSIHVFRVDYTSKNDGSVDKYSGLSLVKEISSDEGAVIAIDHYNTQHNSLVVYATRAGYIHGWDLRARREAYCLRNQANLGLLQSMSSDPSHAWLVGGTSLGYLTCWDLRFQIPVKTWRHPSGHKIHDIRYASPSLLDPSVTAAAAGSTAAANTASVLVASGVQEASVWDIASSSCSQRFVIGDADIANSHLATPQASQEVPPLTQLPESPFVHDGKDSAHSIRALLTPQDCRAVLTGGTDGCIRYWDLAQAQRSYVICGNTAGPPPTYSLHYPDPASPQYCVFQESSSAVGSAVDDSGQSSSRTTVSKTGASGSSTGSARPRGGTDKSSAHTVLEANPVAHRDAIYGLSTIKLSQQLLISCSRDGVIKVWK
eukprot:TRINITY_DN12891_c0_g4_i1.p1 TRINITY_DN12891_c0_g4~~TRINITY_DN12891_c0_g4_i1.p1  ORF type:complete len:1652 (-),score=398.10 TRINITY_DN12891_c0_g4_i1:5-4960(-)